MQHPVYMRQRSTFPMSALFLLVTIAAVLVAVASSGISEWLKSVPAESLAGPLIAAAAFNGLLGPIVMAYQTSNWDTLLLSYVAGVAISLVAMRLFVGPNNLSVAAAGSAILVVYAIVIRFLQPRTESDSPMHGDPS
jgi:NO-binding membrane sensor protein with MHYT domain